MKITYDTQADALYIKLQDGAFVRNKEMVEGVVLDLGDGDSLLGIEILDASTRLSLKDLSNIDIQMPLHLAQTDA
ncbi:MAG: DUF2283 domain-containing protein [Chloroflexi bacterium]|nr:DUF2283 domain-containing protein [Chloroflexota bacterium]MCI0779594.1 DUF2283 domain-containing protein [Chloroflexota bacterium]MCI0888627.1 DUF2283 domain-containing protein [Chloroflexota bacterium]